MNTTHEYSVCVEHIMDIKAVIRLGERLQLGVDFCRASLPISTAFFIMKLFQFLRTSYLTLLKSIFAVKGSRNCRQILYRIMYVRLNIASVVWPSGFVI